MTREEFDDICENAEFNLDWNSDEGISFRAEVKRMAEKHGGRKPKYHKGTHGRLYDYYTCEFCGHTIREIADNYCVNCGGKILWDGIRCLTDYKTSELTGGAE